MKRLQTLCLLPLVGACSWDNSWAPPDEDNESPKADAARGDTNAASASNLEHSDGGSAPTEPTEPTSVNSGQPNTSDEVDTLGNVSPENTDDGASSTEPTSPVTPTAVSPGQDPMASWGTCESQLPTSFSVTCSGCHTPSGAANSRYPDLFAFEGDEAGFVAKVRSGGGGMSAFSDARISDVELGAVYRYFTRASGRELDATPTFQGVNTLFSVSDVNNPPIVFTRSDGVLITRGAGRVRQRHEAEGTFNPFGAHYFEDRSYGFIVEDYTPIGESLIRVSYLPMVTPTDGTNFRAWKIYDNGNVFYANTGMDAGELPELGSDVTATLGEYAQSVAEFATVQVRETTRNPRSDAPIASGDIFEFEFGIFIEADAVRENSRTSYYTDTFRYQVGVGGLTARSDDTSGIVGPEVPAQQGGAGTNVWLYEDQEFAFEQMALNIQHENAQPFLRGRRLFHTDFDSGEHSEGGNPVFEEQQRKLGPLFAAKRCETCHIHNGPGALLTSFDEAASTVFKLYDDSALGNQLQLQEGDVQVSTGEAKVFSFPDGTTVNLTKPEFQLDASKGTVAHYSARIARKVIGLGLLEAISEETILSRADPADCNQDGISGRPLLAVDPETSRVLLGRFGWKAEKVSIRHQVIDALDGDLGVGTHAVPDSAGNVELSREELDDLTAYMRLLSVPAQRDVTAADVQSGQALFQSIGCASCHVMDTVTGATHPFMELRNQAIKPYTDLLLHDMGADLADNSGVTATTDAQSPADAQEWRTPPLWGLGLYATVNGNVGLLHDGRAATALEAVLWHGGEAQGARERFAALAAAQRAQLLTFIESL